MKNCIASQNDILKNNLNEETISHISICKECKSFLEMQKLLKSFEGKKVSCPSHLTFDFIKSKKETKKNNIYFLKYAPLVAAALIMIGIYIPVSFNLNKSPATNSINIAKLNEGINTEIDAIDDMISYAENSMIFDEKLIDGEIVTMFDQIDNMIEEV